MADPRFYDNRGPLTLAAICLEAKIALPSGADGAARVCDLASLGGAGPSHLTFFTGEVGFTSEVGFADAPAALERSRAGFCFVDRPGLAAPAGMTLLPVASVAQAFAAIARLFYPADTHAVCGPGIDPTALIGNDVTVAPDVRVGPLAEIGDGAKIGAGSVIGRGVTIGRHCDIGAHVTISHAFVGDKVVVQPGAVIGQASNIALGRVIIQDRALIGAGAVIARGSLNDTVIGEGARLGDRVQIAPNAHIDRLGAVAS